MNKLSIAGFTNLGYLLHARAHEPLDNDMSGKIVVVTGASGGLGLTAARALAELGARVAIVGRNQEKLELATESTDGYLVPYQADLSLLEEVRSLAGRLHSDLERIDVLVNNVGVLLPSRETTSEGLEKTLATNLAGHFLLTNLIASKLVESAPARVINVTSGGMYAEKIRPDDLQSEKGSYTGTTSYARTKRGQVILNELWADRFAGTGVVVHAMHPGWAATAGVATSLPTFNKVMKPLLRTPEQGADTIVWLASSDEPMESNGQFWFDRQVAPTHIVESTRESDMDRQELWARLLDLTGSDLQFMPVAAR